MTDETSRKQETMSKNAQDGETPENPSEEELKASLDKAEFSQASHMSKEIFGENPKD